jgi:cellulose biosynthesis protein BcsQ
MPARAVAQARTAGELVNLPYDIVLVDCPPGIAGADDPTARFAREVMRIADLILVPLLPSSLDFSAAKTFVRFLREFKSPGTKVAVLINAQLARTRIGRQAAAVAAEVFAPIDGAAVLQTTVGRRSLITEVSGSGKTILDYASPSHEAVREYINLAKELLQWLAPAQTSSPPTSPTSSPSHPDSELSNL